MAWILLSPGGAAASASSGSSVGGGLRDHRYRTQLPPHRDRESAFEQRVFFTLSQTKETLSFRILKKSARHTPNGPLRQRTKLGGKERGKKGRDERGACVCVPRGLDCDVGGSRVVL